MPFTEQFAYTAGQTDLYAYPAGASYALSSTPWLAHRILATELVAGMYTVTMDESKSAVWSVFDGSAVPTSHDDAIATIRYEAKPLVDSFGQVSVGAIATDAIGSNQLSASAVSEIQSGLATTAALATVAGYIDTEVAAIKVTTDKLDTAMQLDGSVYRFTANALELAPSSSGDTISGANTVTITVNYAGQPVQGAKVRMSRVGESGLAETNTSGQVVFSADNGNWTVAITKPGFQFTPVTLVVDGNEAVTYALTAVAIAASDAGRRTVYYTCYGSNGEILAGTTVYSKCIKAPGSGLAIMGTDQSATSDLNGVATFTNRIIGATYEFSMGTGRRITATIPAGSSAVALESIVGK